MNRGNICLSTRRMREQNDGKKKICLTGCHGYLRVVNLQLRCCQLTVTLNCNQKMRLYAIDPIVSVV